jgi:hypothetical protein
MIPGSPCRICRPLSDMFSHSNLFSLRTACISGRGAGGRGQGCRHPFAARSQCWRSHSLAPPSEDPGNLRITARAGPESFVAILRLASRAFAGEPV